MNLKTIACFIGLLVTSNLGAGIVDSQVNLKVDADGKADYTGKSSKTQSRSLNITLSNTGKETITGATIKWTVFGHTMTDHKLVTIKSGQSIKDLPSGAVTEFSSERLEISGVREHSVKSRTGRGRRARTTFKKVPASGHEYYGYAVQVYHKEKLLAESFSQPSIEKLLKPKT